MTDHFDQPWPTILTVQFDWLFQSTILNDFFHREMTVEFWTFQQCTLKDRSLCQFMHFEFFRPLISTYHVFRVIGPLTKILFGIFTINYSFRLASCLKQVTNVSNWKLLSTMSTIICIHFHNLNMNYLYQENVRNRHFRAKMTKIDVIPAITISKVVKIAWIWRFLIEIYRFWTWKRKFPDRKTIWYFFTGGKWRWFKFKSEISFRCKCSFSGWTGWIQTVSLEFWRTWQENFRNSSFL